MRLPDFLNRGDRVVLLSPAGVVDPLVVERAQYALLAWGLEVLIAEHTLSVEGRFAGTCDERGADFIHAMRDPMVKAIFCTRGGYGAIQLLEDLERNITADCRKWLVGYSDVTLLHAFMSKRGVISLHAPMAHHIGSAPDDQSVCALRSLLFGHFDGYRVDVHALNRQGSGCGRLIGGNLAVLMGLRSTPYDFDYDGAILFLEDIGEPAYKIERMIYNLRLGGVFNRIAGLIIGQFTDCEEDLRMPLGIYENISHLVSDFDFPIAFNFPVGHTNFNLPLPVGAVVELKVGSDQVEVVLFS